MIENAHYGYGMYGNDGTWPFFMHGGFSFLIAALLVVFAVLAIRALWHRGKPHGCGDRTNEALEALRLRYAKGEIDKEEFIARKGDLE